MSVSEKEKEKALAKKIEKERMLSDDQIRKMDHEFNEEAEELENLMPGGIKDLYLKRKNKKEVKK